MNPVNGPANSYPEGQCTRWADEQYHAATGFYVPWSDNASGWRDQAIRYGWSVSDSPVIPSIVCLQPGIQGASTSFGHVGFVTSAGQGKFVASNLNWGSQPWNPTNVTFYTAPGVSFIYATDNNGRPIGAQQSGLLSFVSNVTQNNTGPISLAPTADVTELLGSFDNALLLINPFNVPEAQPENVTGPGFSFAFTDPVAYIEGFGLNLAEDLVALTLRTVFLLLALFIFWKVLGNFIDFGAIASSVRTGVSLAAL
jgi:surface antigen